MNMGSRAQPVSRHRDPGPVFSHFAPEMMEDALIQLATENEKRLSELPDEAGSFKETQIVEFVFLLAEKWCLDQPVRYQAVELLERFMIKQVEQICKCSRDNVRSQEREGSSWSSLKDQICDTFVLRLVSCIQLASKLSLHYNELLESELAVLKTLHFQINVSTPLAYVELLLEVLGYNGCLLPVKPLHQMCVQLLDFSYLTRDPIYSTLLETAIENSTPNQLQVAKFLAVKEDSMLLAVGIISTSMFILEPRHWAQVVEHLSSVTGVTSQSISEFSYAVLKHIVGSPTPQQHF
ncbi:cyclin N-terminal domain-containing protein 1 isoform X2 [Pogoniulus pusillus]|uniref:cyclin N-terminal domain-containing protein 1 isoform X2 n=1 Tax=Pogoniulus pusillus TaxID=488313 RepID=UPI0030B93542